MKKDKEKPSHLTPKELRTYGKKFEHLTDQEAWEYIEDVEKFCEILTNFMNDFKKET